MTHRLASALSVLLGIGVLGGCGGDSEQDGAEQNGGGSETQAGGTGGAVASTNGGAAGATDRGDKSSGGTGDTPGTSGGSGGSAAGAPETSGGAGASSGGTDGGTAATAGSAGFGGSCRSVSDCPPGAMSTTTIIWSCVAPYARPPSYTSGTGGMPGWCGADNCDPPPPEPLGSGTSCQSEADCPAPSSDGDPVASVCYLEECRECGTNADCPAARPACISVYGPPDHDYKACVECTSDPDCADGVCSKTNLTCVPECEAPSDCPDPANPCSSHLRCEPQDCADSGTCPRHTTCQSGRCLRTLCSSDADCTDGFCVNGWCYEDLGICASQTIYA